MGLLDILWGYHSRCPVCARYSAKRNAAGQWLCASEACRNYHRKDLVRRTAMVRGQQAGAEDAGRLVARDKAAELARLDALVNRKSTSSPAVPATGPESMNVAARVVLSQFPPESLSVPLDQLVARHGQRTDFVFRFGRDEILTALKTGKLEFTVGDLLKRFPHQVFTDAASQWRDRRITIPLDQITSRVPATWLNRAPVAVGAPSAPKPPPLPAVRHSAPAAVPAVSHASRQQSATKPQPGTNAGCAVGLVGLAVASYVFRFPVPIRFFLTVFAVLAIIGFIQGRTTARGR